MRFMSFYRLTLSDARGSAKIPRLSSSLVECSIRILSIKKFHGSSYARCESITLWSEKYGIIAGGENEKQSHSIRPGCRARGRIRSTGACAEHKLEIEFRTFHRPALRRFHCRPKHNIGCWHCAR